MGVVYNFPVIFLPVNLHVGTSWFLLNIIFSQCFWIMSHSYIAYFYYKFKKTLIF